MGKSNWINSGVRTILLVALLLALTVPVYAEDFWLSDPATGVKVWDPSYLDKRTFTWTGGYKNGYVDGWGTLTIYYNGQISRQYEGTYVLGKLSGQGVLIQNDGADSSRYEGELLNGEKSGKGIMVKQDGTRIEADWQYNDIYGRAIVTWPTGERLDGTFKCGLTGDGVKVWPNGNRYKGGFLVGERYSTGTMTWADGTCYEGNWEDDQCDGYGVVSKNGKVIVKGWFFKNQYVGTNKLDWIYRDNQRDNSD